uniref:Retrovirus-related Pol polyprotein from transposon TNT 1-94-like beta-barrel domain-containing protein n=1 Tax=Tanacetum cinerariifolium TaxID=118510 RepID=A0A6L2P4C6_TANCI|nr:hypothetical protein [Tanacetum cinerariifolium]
MYPCVTRVIVVGNKMHKAFPLPGIEFSLAEEVPTASEEGFHCQKKRDATARKIVLLSKSRRNCQSKSNDSFTKLVPHVTSCILGITTHQVVGKKSGRTVTLTAEDMQKKKNDVKARTTLLLSLPDEHQLRFSKYKTARELWAAILKTFSGNEATKKTKKNLLKKQYGNFKAEGSKNLEQTFNRLQVIVGQLQFMDVEIEQDDLNQKFLTSLAPEWLMHTIVWRNRSNLDTKSLDDLYNHLKVYESEVQKKSEPNSQNMAFISSAKHNSGNEDGNTACVTTASTNSYMANDEEDHALVADEVAPTEFALMANTSAERLAQVESRLVEYKEREVKYCEKIRTLKFRTESNNECIEILKKKIETLKQEKEGVDGKLAGLLIASKDLDNLIESQREDKNKEGLGYSAVPPPAQIYSSPKKDLSWTGLLEFANDTVTDYSRPSPTMESTSGNDQNRNSSVSETVASPITPKPFIKFVKPKDSQSKSKTGETKTPKKPPVKYAEQYKKPSKKPNVRGNQRNWNNLKSQQLGPDIVIKKKACFNCGRSHYRAPWVPTVNRNFPPVNRKFSTGSRNFPTTNRKFPTASRKFLAGSSKCSTADIGMKGKVGNSQNNIDDKGYWDSGCSRHMTGNISYLSNYEPFDGGYVSFGQGGCKITGKGTIKTGKLEFENVYFVKDLKYNLFSVS